jgi:hypothetical protein
VRSSHGCFPLPPASASAHHHFSNITRSWRHPPQACAAPRRMHAGRRHSPAGPGRANPTRESIYARCPPCKWPAMATGPAPAMSVQKLVCDGFVRASDSHAGAETTLKMTGDERKCRRVGGGMRRWAPLLVVLAGVCDIACVRACVRACKCVVSVCVRARAGSVSMCVCVCAGFASVELQCLMRRGWVWVWQPARPSPALSPFGDSNAVRSGTGGERC